MGDIKQNILLPYLKTIFIILAIPARSNPTVSPFHAKEVGENEETEDYNRIKTDLGRFKD